ncbi:MULTISPECIES: PHB depolymerase family esterase [unclassified Meiothermus]|uniref:extracellular catalytic domain type 1 short-chain-length polyhydroxyalkanoate depolymerase n=1 Tax=unclassified Meiothermus TaxID=370471 RepID=UPI001313FBE4|nr:MULTISPECIES: alpha/beta fold hydrolase [unclassified Meiothermus]
MRGLLLILALLVCCAPRQSLAADFRGEIQSGGQVRTYEGHLPPHAGARLPLLLVLHGGGGNGHGMRRLAGMDELADRAGFLVVYPNGYKQSWADGRGTTKAEQAGVDDVAFLRSLIEQLIQKYGVDPRRIYAAGISNGGLMVGRMACELSDEIAAFAVVAATFPERLTATCHPSRPVPILFIHGTLDPILPAAGGIPKVGAGGAILSAEEAVDFWRRLNTCGTSPVEEKLIDPVQDGTQTLFRRWACAQGSQVLFYRVNGGGHTWPGGWQYLPEDLVGRTSRDFSATEAIWAFFDSL